jgi:glutamate-5-semialdehyde dehydrogenase
MKELAAKAKAAEAVMKRSSLEQRNRALEELVKGLDDPSILEANRLDVEEAKENHLSEAMVERLNLDGKIASIQDSLKNVIAMYDPLGIVYDGKILESGLEVMKISIPIGVLGVIYESRPNVTIDVSSVAIKTGNSAVLRGGSETLRTNQALIKVVKEALKKADLPEDAIQLVSSRSRDDIKTLLQLSGEIDLIIPRGGAELQKFCIENSRIPVITGGIGICHIFVDQSADLKKSLDVIENAKVDRPTVCNALDTLLVHEAIAGEFIPMVKARMPQVDFRDSEWDKEWLSLVLGIKIVKGLDEALEHIRKHGSGHSEGILTQDQKAATQFIESVDAAVVFVNASTRFNDASEFGLGAEVAISTQKLHARGPMGLKELTTYKWVAIGHYSVRESS